MRSGTTFDPLAAFSMRQKDWLGWIWPAPERGLARNNLLSHAFPANRLACVCDR